MVQYVAKSCYFACDNGTADSLVDLSDHVISATLTVNGEVIDNTAMASGTTSRAFLGGLLNWQLEVELQQDYASAKVDATLFPRIGGGTYNTVEYRPVAGSRSATNPGYTGEAILESYPVISNTVGELAKTRVVFRGNGALSRSTA